MESVIVFDHSRSFISQIGSCYCSLPHDPRPADVSFFILWVVFIFPLMVLIVLIVMTYGVLFCLQDIL